MVIADNHSNLGLSGVVILYLDKGCEADPVVFQYS